MITLHINKIGEGKNPLVLLHGWGFNQTIWYPLIPALRHHVTLYLVDLPGFGQSSLMNWDVFKEQLLSQLPAHFAILGWSLGGLFATKLAIDEPQRISHLINVTSSPCFIKDKHWPGIEPRVLEQFFTNLSLDPSRTVAEFITLQLQNASLTKKLKVHFPSSFQALYNGLTSLATWDLRSDLFKLKSQTCFMFGRLDAIVPRHLLPIMQARYPKFHYVLFPKAAHMPFMTHQEAFLNELEHFL